MPTQRKASHNQGPLTCDQLSTVALPAITSWRDLSIKRPASYYQLKGSVNQKTTYLSPVTSWALMLCQLSPAEGICQSRGWPCRQSSNAVECLFCHVMLLWIGKRRIMLIQCLNVLDCLCTVLFCLHREMHRALSLLPRRTQQLRDRNKKNGEGKQKLEKSRKWEHLTLCYTSRTWVQVFHTELISSNHSIVVRLS